MATLIFGHKNPDTDSITSAIALSYLKNQLGYKTQPYSLDVINRETRYVLNYFGVKEPEIIENVKIQLKDLELDITEGISPDKSIIDAFNVFKNKNIKTVPVVDKRKHLIGIVTMNDIASGFINSNIYELDTKLTNLVDCLGGEILTRANESIQGKIAVIAYYIESAIKELSEYEIVIVGDRYDVIEEAINNKVKLIVITGGKEIPAKYINLAKKNNVSIISVDKDTYTTAKLINQSNLISTIMRNEGIVQFNENDYLTEVMEEMINSNYRNYPVVNQNGEYLGLVNKNELINPHKKKIILVDHNEYSQSADGIKEAEIIEVVDHHKIGDIATDAPINFRNSPVGSTCTIIYNMMKENNIQIPYDMAGLLLSGIISDTLMLKSPTTTDIDRCVLKELNDILKLDIEKYTLEMLKAGTSLEGFNEKEIFHQDFKEFNIEEYKIGISQVFTLDIESILSKKNDFLDYIQKVQKQNGYYFTLMVVTDVMKEGSYLFFNEENKKIIEKAFEVNPEEGVFIEDILSRKKQVVPKISHALRY